MWTAIGALFTTLGVVATAFIQKKNTDKKDKIETLLSDIKIDIQQETLNRCKADLINAMSEIHNGTKLTEEQRRIIYEEKETYNSLGGNSYVDDMFDRLKKEGKL
jgi:hypothetical protein